MTTLAAFMICLGQASLALIEDELVSAQVSLEEFKDISLSRP
jgi:hypothetical protein